MRKIFALFLSTFCLLGFCAEAAQNPPLSQKTFTVSLGDLFFDGQNNILFQLNGVVYPIHSLEKSGNSWIATVLVEPLCSGGHISCPGCGLCHRPGCRQFAYYCIPKK